MTASDSREREIWTHLRTFQGHDLGNHAQRIMQLTNAITTAIEAGYIENVEMVAEPESALRDAQVVDRLTAHLEAEVERLSSTINQIVAHTAELMELAPRGGEQ